MKRETYASLMKKGNMLLQEAGIEDANLDAWLLLEYIIGQNRAWYFLHQMDEASEETVKAYLQLIEKRKNHIPLQHLTHQGFFMGYEFYVNENVLIPRQDTEILVETALKVMEGMSSPHILDMCTGSGCILLSLLMEQEDATGTGVDVSEKALEVAMRNRERLNLSKRACFLESNLFSSQYFHKKDGNEQVKYDILISNPPYIPTGEIRNLMEEVRLHDPMLALDGMEDGLFFYHEITNQAKDYMKSGAWLLYEIGHDQGSTVSAIMREAGFEHISVTRDLAGLDRVVSGRMPLIDK